MTRRETGRAIGYMLIAAFFFCFTEICLKELNHALHPVELNFSRYLLAGLLLWPVSCHEIRRRQGHISRHQWLRFHLLGFVGITIVGPLYQLAAVRLNAGLTSVLFSTTPVFIAVLAAIILHERLSRWQLGALLVELAAILILIHPSSLTLDPLGLLFLAVTVFCYSLYAVWGKEDMNTLGSVTVTSYSFLCGGMQLLLLALLSHLPFIRDSLIFYGWETYAAIPLFSGYTLANAGWVLLLYFGVTLGAYLCWFKAMEYGSTALGSLTYFIKPALSPVFAWLILGEIIDRSMAAGMTAMLIGAALGIIGTTRHPSTEPVIVKSERMSYHESIFK
ncbi:DMT family transporter [Megasphaera sp.]|uniref:DMT family transporter n=1 Tax=Megasphaera sp. TaxID=2023260 RepID=UPI003EFE192A